MGERQKTEIVLAVENNEGKKKEVEEEIGVRHNNRQRKES